MTEHSPIEAQVLKVTASISSYFDDEKTEKTILVPLPSQDDLDQDNPDPHDELAAELSMLQQKSKSIAIIGSRNIPLPHQQLVEMLAFSLTHGVLNRRPYQ